MMMEARHARFVRLPGPTRAVGGQRVTPVHRRVLLKLYVACGRSYTRVARSNKNHVDK